MNSDDNDPGADAARRKAQADGSAQLGERLAQVLRAAASSRSTRSGEFEALLGGIDEGLIEELLKVAGNWHVGHPACIALAAIGPRILPVAERLTRDTGVVPPAVLRTLGAIRDPRSADLLMYALVNGDDWSQREAAIALGELQDTRAIPMLREVLGVSSRRVRCAAAAALGAMADRDSLSAVLALTNEVGDDPGEDFDDLRWAFCALGGLGGETAVRRLSEGLLDDRLDQAAFEGLRVLVQRHPREVPGAYSSLVLALADDRPFIVDAALEILASAPDASLVAPLASFLSRPDIEVVGGADEAARLLEAIGTDASRDAILKWRQRRGAV